MTASKDKKTFISVCLCIPVKPHSITLFLRFHHPAANLDTSSDISGSPAVLREKAYYYYVGVTVHLTNVG